MLNTCVLANKICCCRPSNMKLDQNAYGGIEAFSRQCFFFRFDERVDQHNLTSRKSRKCRISGIQPIFEKQPASGMKNQIRPNPNNYVNMI